MSKNRYNRRTFIRSSGAAAAGLSIAPAFLEGLFADVFGPVLGPDAEAKHVITACGLCDSACGLKATVKDGVLTFVEGVPEDLQGGGKLCGKGKSAAGFLYDPDRLKYPMKRTNPVKGIDVDPGWVRISWDEALQTASDRLRQTIAASGPDSVLVLSRPAPDIWMRFVNAIGTPNRVDHIDECFLSDKIVSGKVFGGKLWGHDLNNSKYILLFGWDLVGKAKMAYARQVVNAKKNGAKIVMFNPMWTPTANLADEWHMIRPGSDLAVALAMINVIVQEKLYDRTFVETYTNYNAYEKEVRANFAPYTPEWAADLSDVPADTIRRIAREFALTRPGIVPTHKKTSAANYGNAASLQHAIAFLNCLNGSVDRPGGRFYPRGIEVPGVDAIFAPPAYPPKNGVWIDGRDRHPFIKAAGNGMFSTLAHGMLVEHPDKIQMTIVCKYTTMSFPNPPEIASALAKVPFTVVIDIVPNEVINLADIVMPQATYLESADIAVREHYPIYPQAFVRQPVVPAMFETKGLGWIAIEWGKRSFPEYFKKADGTWLNMNEILDEKVKRSNIAADFAGFKAAGSYSKPAPLVPKTKFPTPDGLLRLYVKDFADKGYDPLPNWMPKRDLPSSEYPFYLITVIPNVHIRNTTGNNAYLNEIYGTNFVLMHPATAQGLGVEEGDLVRVRSRANAITLPAHLSSGIRSDCVCVPHGFGHRSRLMTKAFGKGERDSDLVPSQSMDEIIARRDVGGAAAIMDAVVALERAG
ncbi:MAG TPA: molybdopterin-dependent oxidoreductase [Thermoanaerobaculia bacterium]|nr:molybdopterin-dependent oxidoreductase [Thermoanaerobaculia bacterium]